MDEVRIDKCLWAVRIFKTRSIATDACRKGRVAIDGTTVKPARMLQRGAIVSVRKPPVTYSFRVLELIGSRVGAKLVPQYMENVTASSTSYWSCSGSQASSTELRGSAVRPRRTVATSTSSPTTSPRVWTSSIGTKTGMRNYTSRT